MGDTSLLHAFFWRVIIIRFDFSVGQTLNPQLTGSGPTPLSRCFSIAPMMDYTDMHCRYFHRLLSHRALLYTEMITTGALLHGDRSRFLTHHPSEHPLAIQLGGSDPGELARSAKIASDAGFEEINMNCGCPSDRVVSGRFGAVLMKNPALVAECFRAMQEATETPVTIKHRLGVDELDSYEFLSGFVGQIAEAGCKTFIVHARKAWLSGLSPKQNREIPPLQYDQVYRLKRDFPQLEIILNGGIKTLDECETHLRHVDGVMMGREAYQNPYLLSEVDCRLFGDETADRSRSEIVEKLLPYLEQQIASGVPLKHITRHILGLYKGIPGSREFRRLISENVHKPGSDLSLIKRALTTVY